VVSDLFFGHVFIGSGGAERKTKLSGTNQAGFSTRHDQTITIPSFRLSSLKIPHMPARLTIAQHIKYAAEVGE